MSAPTAIQANWLGSTGSPHSEIERLLFEAYMKGHNWAIGTWNNADLHYEDGNVRVLFAVWRDSAYLHRNRYEGSKPTSITFAKVREDIDQLSNSLDEWNAKFGD